MDSSLLVEVSCSDIERWDKESKELVLPEDVKRDIVSDALECFSDQPRWKCGTHLYAGRAGVGKSMTLKWVLSKVKREFPELKVFWVDGSKFYDQNLGQSAKGVADAFFRLKAITQAGLPVALGMDEVEAIIRCRAKAALANEPGDIGASVTETLKGLDAVMNAGRAYVGCTSNRDQDIDASFIDRVTVLAKFKSLTVQVVEQILIQGMNKAGARLDSGSLSRIAVECKELSGRKIRALPGLAFRQAGVISDESMMRAIRKAKAQDVEADEGIIVTI